MGDPGLLCLSHCGGGRVFAAVLPDFCPLCRSPISGSQAIPFRVPYPFVKASQYPCAVVIKPTFGDFLHDFEDWKDLHAGVTDARGKVWEFDREGLHEGRPWEESLVVFSGHGKEHVPWEPTLEAVTSQRALWDRRRYSEERFNCFTFVLCFLTCLGAEEVSAAARSKEAFSREFISPRLTRALKYIALYRRIRDSGYFVDRTSDT